MTKEATCWYTRGVSTAVWLMLVGCTDETAGVDSGGHPADTGTFSTDSVDGGDRETARGDSGGAESGRDTDRGDTSGSTDSDGGSDETGGGDELMGAEAKLIGEDAGDYAGAAVVATGDMDGDGRSDMLVVAPERDVDAVYFVRGAVSGRLNLLDADGVLTTEIDGEPIFGWSHLLPIGISSAGDQDGDGMPDLIVGTYSAGSDTEGAAWLFSSPWSGSRELSDSDAHFTGVSGGHYAGYAVAGSGDVDGDGWDDVLVGAPAIDESGAVSDKGDCATEATGWGDEDGESAGAVYLLSGPMSGEHSLSEADARITGEDGYDGAGTSLAQVGDLNGDAMGDIFVGSTNCEGGDDAGAAYVVLGPTSGELSLADADAKLIGESTEDHASNVLSSAGDVDGDGSPDLLVAAPKKDLGSKVLNGKVYLVLGVVSGDTELADADATFVGDEVALAGSALAPAGDVDLDGHDDFLVGAANSSVGAHGAGSTFLIRGPVEGTTYLPDITPVFSGAATNDGVGCAVAGLGDTDGDGLPDILIGAMGDDEGGDLAGAAWVLSGASL